MKTETKNLYKNAFILPESQELKVEKYNVDYKFLMNNILRHPLMLGCEMNYFCDFILALDGCVRIIFILSSSANKNVGQIRADVTKFENFQPVLSLSLSLSLRLIHPPVGVSGVLSGVPVSRRRADGTED